MPSFETPEPIAVDIEIPAGTVHLIADDRQDTTVVVNPSNGSNKKDVEAAARTTVDMSAGRLTVDTPKPGGLTGRLRWSRYGSVNVTVELPRASSIEIEAGAADIRVDGPGQEIHVQNGIGKVHIDDSKTVDIANGAGDMSLGRVGGRAAVTSAGDMRIERIDGDAEIKNLNGRTRIGEVAGRLQIKSSNGDIDIGKAHTDVDAKTANGSIAIAEAAGGRVSLETGAGSLEIGVGKGTKAWLDARTKFGRVNNALDDSGEPTPGDRTVEISARTALGDISVVRTTGNERSAKK